MSRRSICIVLGFSTLVGLVVAVLVAWTISWTDRAGHNPISASVVFGKAKREGVSFGFFASIGPDRENYEVRQLESVEGTNERATTERVPALPRWADARTGVIVTSTGYGWPFPCLMGRRVGTSVAMKLTQSDLEGWWVIERGPIGYPLRRFPLLPIVGGLAANSTLLGLPLGLLFIGAWRMIRNRRHSAGRCVRCGYSLHGIVGGCPECGQTRPPSPDARGGEGAAVAEGSKA